MADRLDMKSMDITQGNIEKIRALFPSAVTEVMGEDGKVKLAIDFDALKQELSDDLISEKAERYQMTWPDKSKAKVLANSRITATLRPDVEKSVDFDTTENLYIEGDNLDVLKLLRETYLGKVKMIYIDPPYNTGNDFVYEDDFAMSTEDYAEVSGQYDEQGNRLVKNLDSNGRFHTDWLNMIYPRLKVARDLLSDDGVIFISIDENEVENLKKVCKEIFGENNFVAQIVLVNNIAGRSDSKNFATAHEYILVYQKSALFLANGLPLSSEQLAEYKYSDDNGQYRLQGLRKRGSGSLRSDRPNMWYPIYYSESSRKVSLNESDIENPIIITPKLSDGSDGRWRWGKDTFEKKKQFIEIRTVSGRNEYDAYEKVYLNGEDGEKTTKMKSFLLDSKYTTDTATTEYKSTMEQKTFESPKSISLIKDLIMVGGDKDSLFLDFFSGSATTAHAVMQLNAEDGGNRKFIMVQLPEKCDEKSEAYKAGYKTICDIGEERIRRAGKKIKEEGGLATQDLDIGFRVLKLDSSNMQEVYYNPSAMTQDILAMTVDNVKADRTALDLLFQVMLDLGIELSAKIEEHTVSGKTYYTVNGNDIIACFDDDIDNDVITAIAKQNPLYAVFKDKSFATDSVGINNEQLFKTYSPSTVVKVI